MVQRSYKQNVILSRALRELQEGKIPQVELYDTIHQFGRNQFLEARPDIETFLSNPDSNLRAIALEVLSLHFHLIEHVPTAQHMLQKDPDEMCRDAAAQALAVLLRNTVDRETLTILAHIVSDAHEFASVRTAAYIAMHAIIAYDPKDALRRSFQPADLSKDIDWDLVKKYL